MLGEPFDPGTCDFLQLKEARRASPMHSALAFFECRSRRGTESLNPGDLTRSQNMDHDCACPLMPPVNDGCAT